MSVEQSAIRIETRPGDWLTDWLEQQLKTDGVMTDEPALTNYSNSWWGKLHVCDLKFTEVVLLPSVYVLVWIQDGVV